MKTMIKSLTERIQRLFNKPNDVAVTIDDPVVEVFITGYQHYDNELERYVQEQIDTDFFKFKDLLKDLYNQVLNEDDSWHFFLEGDYNILRFSSRFRARVQEILDKHEVVYVRESLGGQASARVWIDEQETTREHQKYFERIFHEYSLMAIQIEDYTIGKLKMLADRVAHCFFNHQFINFQKELDKNHNIEAEIMNILAVSRASYTGYLVGYRQAYKKASDAVKKDYEERVSNMKETLDKIEKLSDVNAAEVEDLRVRVEGLGINLAERVLQ